MNKFILASKTINFNILAGAVVYLLKQYGIEVTTEEVTTILIAGNIILRLLTKTGIHFGNG